MPPKPNKHIVTETLPDGSKRKRWAGPTCPHYVDDAAGARLADVVGPLTPDEPEAAPTAVPHAATAEGRGDP